MTDATFNRLTVTNELIFPKYNTSLSNLYEKTVAFTRNSEFFTTYLHSDTFQVTRPIISLTSLTAPLIQAQNINATNSILLNGVPITTQIEGVTISVSGNQTTFQRNGNSSSLQFSVLNSAGGAVNHDFTSTAVNIPTRIFLTHPNTSTPTERSIHACFHSNINTQNYSDVIMGRCYSDNSVYNWENLSVAGSFRMWTRVSSDPLVALQNVFEVSPTQLLLPSTQRINQTISLDTEPNLMKRVQINRQNVNNENGSNTATLSLVDTSTPGRGINFNQNAVSGYLNPIVQLNDAVISRVGQNANGSIVLTGWASGTTAIAGGIRISFTPTIPTATVESRAGSTSLMVHSEGFVNINRQLFFNAATGTDRRIQNLSTLSLCTTAHATTAAQTDYTLSLDVPSNQIRYQSFRNGYSHVFQVQNSSSVQTDRLIVSDLNITANRIPLRTMSNANANIPADQRQFVMRISDADGYHYLHATNHATSGTGSENRIVIALGRSDGANGIINTEPFIFRHMENLSTVVLRTPSLNFTGDNTTQTTAFTTTHAARITQLGFDAPNERTSLLKTNLRGFIFAPDTTLGGIYNNIVQPGDSAIVFTGASDGGPGALTLTNQSPTKSGFRIKATETEAYNLKVLDGGVKFQDNTVQSTAFTSAQVSQINSASSTATNAYLLADEALATANIAFGQSNTALTIISPIGLITRWGGAEVKFQDSTFNQQLHEHSLLAGTYIITYTANLYTKQIGEREIYMWATWLYNSLSEEITQEWESSRIVSHHFRSPNNLLKDTGKSHHSSIVINLTTTTTIRLISILYYWDINTWNNDGSSGNGKWSYAKSYLTAVRIK
jgi:hypothetical protein